MRDEKEAEYNIDCAGRNPRDVSSIKKLCGLPGIPDCITVSQLRCSNAILKQQKAAENFRCNRLNCLLSFDLSNDITVHIIVYIILLSCQLSVSCIACTHAHMHASASHAYAFHMVRWTWITCIPVVTASTTAFSHDHDRDHTLCIISFEAGADRSFDAMSRIAHICALYHRNAVIILPCMKGLSKRSGSAGLHSRDL